MTDRHYSEYTDEYEQGERALREEAVLDTWREERVFEKTLEKDSPKGEFVFFEGPPTANGRPGIHHIEARSFKDIIPRFRTMQGYHVRRKGGWDTHGLPVELEVEKRLGIKSKKEIEEYGVAKFNEECKKSVWTYAREWHAFTKRIAYWVDLDNAYVTYHPEYIESLWNIVHHIDSRGLLYKDYKVLPWCPRCGTALSSHELAQGYQDTTDVSVYAKFKLKDAENTYLLAWTTTPWTLPGNVALAVGEKVVYVRALVEGEELIVAKELLSVLPEGAEVLEEMPGSSLVGVEYEPLFPYIAEHTPEDQREKLNNAFKVHAADFVTVEDGTGVVHTAVMYGQDDFELGNSVGLPKVHLVDEQGKFKENMGELSGLPVKEKDTFSEGEKAVLRALEKQIFKKEKYTHSYPFCWRCKSHIIYYAHDSWYVAMSTLRDELVEENQSINWEPAHIKEGRFGEWLSNIKDWAISRERYWGTPLPVWLSEDGTERMVVDSIDTLKRHIQSNKNRFFVMRHGQARSNAEDYLNAEIDPQNILTETGRAEVDATAATLVGAGITAIYCSPLPRTMESATHVAEVLGIDPKAIVVDERLRETNFGALEREETGALERAVPFGSQFEHAPEGGETMREVRSRVHQALRDIDRAHTEEKVLVVTHADCVWMAGTLLEGLSERQALWYYKEGGFPKTGEVKEFAYSPLPRNETGDIDLHRPYVDEVVLIGESGAELTRTKEVMDVWFDSGAMPFAQDHYPFENRERIDGAGFPADYISEAIDQTRGWFYTLHAVGVLMGRGKAYKNVICLGHILDNEGKKMSKSLGNIVNPWEMIAKYGVDALRFWMYSVNQPGDSKNFDERTVDEIVKKVFNLLSNVVKFYELYKDTPHSKVDPYQSPNVLDRWILARYELLVLEVVGNLESYKVLESSRAIRAFIGDLSQWYIRRSRDRFKGEDEEDRRFALATTRHLLDGLARLLAPFTPFLAEEVYRAVAGADAPESVHLASYPEAREGGSDEAAKLLKQMEALRAVVSLAHEARTAAGIKVRQPLGSLRIKHETLEGASPELLAVLRDEVNVKEVIYDAALTEVVVLDTTITEELKEEGVIREVLRTLQDMRKSAGLSRKDTVALIVESTPEGVALIEKYAPLLESSAQIAKVEEGKGEGEPLLAEGYQFNFAFREV